MDKDWNENIDLADILISTPVEKPACPLCSSADGLFMFGVRRVNFSLDIGSELTHELHIRCRNCKSYLSRDSSEKELSSYAVVDGETSEDMNWNSEPEKEPEDFLSYMSGRLD